MKIQELFSIYADKVLAEDYTWGKVRFSIRSGNGFYVTKDSFFCVENFTENDIEYVQFGEDKAPLLTSIYSKYPKINAVIISNTPHCSKLAETITKLPPVLDDMAQIVGTSAKVTKTVSQTVSALRSSSCALFTVCGTVSVGVTLFEAYVATTVLEKSALVYLQAQKLGGARQINMLEATLMHAIYKKKYSKNEQGRKLAEMEVEG